MIEQIVGQVARERGLTLAQVMSRRKDHASSAARHEAMRRMMLAGRTVADIAVWFRCDRKTVHHGLGIRSTR